jgi:hypothetical protein
MHGKLRVRRTTSRRTLLGTAGASAAVLASSRLDLRATAAQSTPTAGAADFTVNAWGTTEADFARVGIERDTLAVWEDGFRTAEFVADPRSYEWWYLDLIGQDGTIVVFVILTRASLYVPGDVPARPAIALDITPPGQQTRWSKRSRWRATWRSPDLALPAWTRFGRQRTRPIPGRFRCRIPPSSTSFHHRPRVTPARS